MTVAELIKKLQEVEDSSKEVLIQYYDAETMITMSDHIVSVSDKKKFLYISCW